MKDKSPILRILFHNKDGQACYAPTDLDAKPLRQRIFVFWNPADAGRLSHTATHSHLYGSFEEWAQQLPCNHYYLCSLY